MSSGTPEGQPADEATETAATIPEFHMCTRCGALVGDWRHHHAWHKHIEGEGMDSPTLSAKRIVVWPRRDGRESGPFRQ